MSLFYGLIPCLILTLWPLLDFIMISKYVAAAGLGQYFR